MTVEQILELDGVVIRKIPATTITKYKIHQDAEDRHQKAKHFMGEGLDRREVKYSYERDENGVLLAINTRKNTLAGYLVEIQNNQYSQVHFSKKYSGHGSTIVEAYNDFLLKNKS